MPTVKIPGIGPVEKKWVYIGGAFVVGIVGYAYWNKSRADAAETEVSDYTEGPGYAMDSGVDEYVNPGGSQAPVEEDYVTAPSTNAEWAQKAIAILVDTGYDPIEASIAVGRYLARQSLTSTQANMIRAASAQLGPPPVGDFPITITPTTPTPKPDEPKPPVVKPPAKPPVKPKPPAPSGKYVTVTRWPLPGSSLWSIATREYKDGRKWTRIWNDSRNASLKKARKDPKKIRPGDRFWVPK
jgi:hypothetical protein